MHPLMTRSPLRVIGEFLCYYLTLLTRNIIVTPWQRCTKQIISDLEYAEANLPDEVTSYYFPNKRCAYALQHALIFIWEITKRPETMPRK